MKINNFIECFFRSKLGLKKWFDIRYFYPNISRAFFMRSFCKRGKNITKNPKIVIMGSGVSALTVIEALKEYRHTKAVIISNGGYGGRCVSIGCMPSAFVIERAAKKIFSSIEEIQHFVKKLSDSIEFFFRNSGFELIQDEILRIEGKQVILTSGKKIDFDVLVSCLGAKKPIQSRVFAKCEKLITLEQFWNNSKIGNLTIYAENIGALALADIARLMGYKVNVILRGRSELINFPAFEYFKNELIKKGICIFDEARILRVDEDKIIVERDSIIDYLGYDFLILMENIEPNFLKIDGILPNYKEFNIENGSLVYRDDIFFLGDNSGLLTVKEAEHYSRAVVDKILFGVDIDLGNIRNLPICFHAEKSLAITGGYWPVLKERKWIEIDFNLLGWTHINNSAGKIWFLYDHNQNKLLNINVCHEKAAELIVFGQGMIDKSIDEIEKQIRTVHPSAFEIYDVFLRTIKKSINVI